ncbi:MAG: hypothetical protein KC733_09235, partial [Candidatus Omnitrophica bacterium]|nr:hypothetical protein [Candidatus Omnitrophota bacterium]
MLNFKKQQKLCLIIFSCTFVFFFASCRPHPVEILIKKSERKYLMGTHVQLDICVDKTESEENIAAAFAKAWERL